MNLSAAHRDLLAYAAPFLVFMGLGSLEGIAPLADYYPFVYTVKIAAVLGTWIYFRDRYPKYSSHGMGWGILAGVVGVIVWIPLAAVPVQQYLPSALHGMLGGTRTAYNPLEAITSPWMAWLFLAVRFLGLAVAVPLMEEVFWRGLLLRYVISENFTQVAIGTLTPASFAIVTVLFTLVHPEMLAAAVWCAGINLLCQKTGNLWACIVAHAVTNLLLGVYIVATGHWQLW